MRKGWLQYLFEITSNCAKITQFFTAKYDTAIIKIKLPLIYPVYIKLNTSIVCLTIKINSFNKISS